MVVLSDRRSVARKTYRCDATRQILDIAFYDDFTQEELDQVDRAVEEGSNILPGTIYRRVVYVEDGDFHTYRARPEMDVIAHKHEMWGDDV